MTALQVLQVQLASAPSKQRGPPRRLRVLRRAKKISGSSALYRLAMVRVAVLVAGTLLR